MKYDRLAAAETLAVRTAELLFLYHEAYAAHHRDGPNGCPCCAEFRPQVEAATRAMERASRVHRRAIEQSR